MNPDLKRDNGLIVVGVDSSDGAKEALRFALRQENELVPHAERVRERFENWMAQQANGGRMFTPEQAEPMLSGKVEPAWVRMKIPSDPVF